MAFSQMFLRIIARPLRAEPLRTLLTLLAVALGVAVVIAIDLAGDAAAGSFRSSMETLTGKSTLEISATGGIDERVLGRLAALDVPVRFSPRVEGFAMVERGRFVVPLVGIDLLTVDRQDDTQLAERPSFDIFRDPKSVWVSANLGLRKGEQVRLTVNDRSDSYTVRGAFESADRFIAMDIGAAQAALRKLGRLDRIEVFTPPPNGGEQWQEAVRKVLPPGVDIAPRGTATESNRKMLAAFRWNLRVLSYISLVVGGFLIFNTISVSVVRRRAEIGVLRALGATRMQVLLLFLSEAALFGLVGGLVGLMLGKVMAGGAVQLIATTVQSLYVSSTPGEIAVSWQTVVETLMIGLGLSFASALAPAREAALVPPVEAMARGQREYHARVHAGRDFAIASVLAVTAYAAAQMDAYNGRPIAGYAASFLLIIASALAIPAAIQSVSGILSAAAERLLGLEGMLASRSIAASLSRTSVLVAALSTAVAMMVSVGIMVGSFRKTVGLWMEAQLQADFYLRPATGGGANRYPTISPDLADRIENLPAVRDVDRFRVYEITYNGMPALFGGGETNVVARNGRTGFLPGQDRAAILAKLPAGDYCIVSEPFANKHRVKAGDKVTIKLATGPATFVVLGVYYDYSNERGYVIVDRATLLRHLPDPSPSSLAVYLKPAVGLGEARTQIESVTGCGAIVIFSNRSLREEAIRIFDRTFAITWALEAVAILVAVLGVAGALLALVIDRRRELGLLRFLGASTGQLRRLILCEAGMLGLLANAVGLTLGYFLSLILIYVINVQSFGWTIQFHWPVALLVSALSLIYVATVVSGLYPARLAVSLNPIEVIHEE
ncbi:MAG: ABC transporter permease [Bryobacterales bacterium]|nr:ABC transporter permease [Bryobacterales bacterium]